MALMGFGLFSALSGGGIGGLWLVLIGFFVLNASRGTYQRLLMEDSLRGRRVAELMTPDPWTASPEMTLADLADRVMLANAVSFAPVVEQGQRHRTDRRRPHARGAARRLGHDPRGRGHGAAWGR